MNNSIINKSKIEEALEFYDISNLEYMDKCYKCIDYINANDVARRKIYEVYDILYKDKTNKIATLWECKKDQELFGIAYYPFVTNVLLLLGYEFHKSNIEKFEFDTLQIQIHKKRVRECLTKDIEIRNYESIRISQMLWGAYFVNVRLIEVGRLQYEIVNENPMTLDVEKCIKIHIPSGEKLDINKVVKSLKKSKKEIKKYFNLGDFKYYCKTWLLSKQIHKVADENSNIYKFYDLFEVKEENSCIGDVLNFVYNLKTCDDFNLLPEETSLQRKIKNMLLNNEDIFICVGSLKQEFIN